MSSDAHKGLVHSSRFTESGLRVADDVLGLIEKTPLVRLARLSPPGGATVWAKAEFVNPAGSVKDRPALSMILSAEKSGELKPGATLVEATSGNTGISLAMIAAVRGYRCLLVMPEDMSLERRYILRAYGAEIVLTPAGDGMSGAVSKALRLLEDTPGRGRKGRGRQAGPPGARRPPPVLSGRANSTPPPIPPVTRTAPRSRF